MIHNQIITYGLTNEEIVELQNVKPNKDCSIIIADCATDIIAIGAYAAVVRKSELDQSDYDLLSSYLEEVGDYADTIILVGEDNKLKSFSKKVKIFATFEDFLEWINDDECECCCDCVLCSIINDISKRLENANDDDEAAYYAEQLAFLLDAFDLIDDEE